MNVSLLREAFAEFGRGQREKTFLCPQIIRVLWVLRPPYRFLEQSSFLSFKLKLISVH